MLCQNCGRRSSDSKSFCTHCGAVASPDLPTTAESIASRSSEPPRASTQTARPQPRVTVSRRSASGQGPSRAARSGSNALATLIFWGLLAYGVYWFMGDDGRELRSLLNDLMQQQIRQQTPDSESVPPPRPVSARPPVQSTPDAPVRAVPPEATERTREAPAARPVGPPAASPASPRASGPGAAPAAPARGVVPTIEPATGTPATPDRSGAPPAADPRGAPVDADVEGLSPAQVIQRLGRPTAVITSNGVTAWSYRNGTVIVYFVKDRATLRPPR